MNNINHTGQSERSIETMYDYENDNATFRVTTTVQPGVRTSYDYITIKQDLNQVIARFCNSLTEEPQGLNSIQLSICVYENIPDFSRVFLSTYLVAIELVQLSFRKDSSPFHHLVGYEEFSLEENVKYRQKGNSADLKA